MFQAGTEVGKVAAKVEVMLDEGGLNWQGVDRGEIEGEEVERGDVDGDRAGADKGEADKEEEDVLEMEDVAEM